MGKIKVQKPAQGHRLIDRGTGTEIQFCLTFGSAPNHHMILYDVKHPPGVENIERMQPLLPSCSLTLDGAHLILPL